MMAEEIKELKCIQENIRDKAVETLHTVETMLGDSAAIAVELFTKISEQEKIISGLNEKNYNLSKCLEDTKTALDVLRSKNDEYEKTASVSFGNAAFKAELDKFKGELDYRKRELDKFKGELDSRKMELDNREEKLKNDRDEFETEKQRLIKRNTELQESVKNATGLIQTLAANEDKLKKEKEDLEESNTQLKENVRNLTEQKGKEIGEKELYIKLLEEDKRRLESKIKVLEEEKNKSVDKTVVPEEKGNDNECAEEQNESSGDEEKTLNDGREESEAEAVHEQNRSASVNQLDDIPETKANEVNKPAEDMVEQNQYLNLGKKYKKSNGKRPKG